MQLQQSVNRTVFQREYLAGLDFEPIGILTRMRNVPLSIASWLGIFCTGFSFLAIVFIAVRKLLFGDPVQGWASTMCVNIFMGGCQLFCMGVIGQYIGKTYTETKKRPHYLISECSDDTIPKIG